MLSSWVTRLLEEGSCRLCSLGRLSGPRIPSPASPCLPQHISLSWERAPLTASEGYRPSKHPHSTRLPLLLLIGEDLSPRSPWQTSLHASLVRIGPCALSSLMCQQGEWNHSDWLRLVVSGYQLGATCMRNHLEN